MLDIIISIQRIDTTKESVPVIMEFDGLVDITQRFATLVRSAIRDKKDLFLVPTDYYKRETDAVAYIVGSDHSVYKISIFEKMHISSITYRKVRLKDLVSEAQFSEYIYKLSYALAHSFIPTAFSTIPKKKCNCDNDHCDCHKDEQKDVAECPHVPLTMETRTLVDKDGNEIDMFSERDEIKSITEEDAESGSKFKPRFRSLRK